MLMERGEKGRSVWKKRSVRKFFVFGASPASVGPGFSGFRPSPSFLRSVIAALIAAGHHSGTAAFAAAPTTPDAFYRQSMLQCGDDSIRLFLP